MLDYSLITIFIHEKNNMSDKLVYSTETGRIKQDNTPPKSFTGDGIVRLRRETKGRKGKGMSIVDGINPLEHDLAKLCKQLKKQCGCGGSVKNNTIEIQGDVRDKLNMLLTAQGFTVKLAGG
jgi:translation initiation factor 1